MLRYCDSCPISVSFWNEILQKYWILFKEHFANNLAGFLTQFSRKKIYLGQILLVPVMLATFMVISMMLQCIKSANNVSDFIVKS